MKPTLLLSLVLAIPALSPAVVGQATRLAYQSPKVLSISQSEDGEDLEIRVYGAAEGEHLMLVGYVSILDNPLATPEGLLFATALADQMQPVTESRLTYESTLASVVGEVSSTQLFLPGTASQFNIPASIAYGVLRDFVGYSTPTSIQPSLDWMTERVPGWSGQYVWQGSRPVAVPPNPPSLVVPWLDVLVDPRRPGVFRNEEVVRYLIANQFTTTSGGAPYGAFDEEVSEVVQAMKNGTIEATMNMQLVNFDGTHVSGRPRVKISVTHKPKIVLPLDPYRKFAFRFRQGPGAVYVYPGLAGARITVEADTAFRASQVGKILVAITTATGRMFVKASVTQGEPWMDFVVPPDAVDGPIGALDLSVKPPVVLPMARYDETASSAYVDLKMYSASR